MRTSVLTSKTVYICGQNINIDMYSANAAVAKLNSKGYQKFYELGVVCCVMTSEFNLKYAGPAESAVPG